MNYYHYVGWLAVPGFLLAALPAVGTGAQESWRGRLAGGFELRVAALAGTGFLAVALMTYGGFSPSRYLLLAAVCLWFVACTLLDRIAEELARWRSRHAARRSDDPRPAAAWVRWLPLLILLPALFQSAITQVPVAVARWNRYTEFGQPRPREWWDLAALQLCEHLDPDVIVASVHPWSIYFSCGTAGLRLPKDLRDPEILSRYLDAETPAFVVVDRDPAYAFLGRASALERIVTWSGGLTIYRVRDADERSRAWRAPPPLASLLPPAAAEPPTSPR
jgi:hypothetical protein